MIERVEELMSMKGLRWADLARKVGITQSNLVSSLKGNPKLSRLQEVADALGVAISELFAEHAPAAAVGTVEIEQKTYSLVPTDKTPPPFYFCSPSALKVKIHDFVRRCVLDDDTSAFGFSVALNGLHPVTVFYEPIISCLNFMVGRDKDDFYTSGYEMSKYRDVAAVSSVEEAIDRVVDDMFITILRAASKQL